MVALHEDATPSLLEAGVRKLQAVKSRRLKGEGAGLLRRVWNVATDVTGTVLALACFVIAAFMVGAILGYAVAGVAFLLLDFKASLIRRARASSQTAGRRMP